MAVPWKVKDGIYYLKDDSKANRKLLRKHISKQVLKNRASGLSNTEGFSTVFLGKDGVPHRLGSVDKFISGKTEFISFRNKVTAAKAKATKLANMTQPNEIVLDWVENLNRSKAWPEGKSLEGFIQWAVDNYKGTKSNAELVESLTGVLSDAGHATDKGFSSITGLAPQPRYDQVKGNQNFANLSEEFKDTNTKANLVKGPDGQLNFIDPNTNKPINPERGTFKTATQNVRNLNDLEAVDIGFSPHKAFEEYINIDAKDLNILPQEGWSQAQKTATLFDPEYASTALGADIKVRDEILNKRVVQETLKNNPIPQTPHLMSNTTQEIMSVTSKGGVGRKIFKALPFISIGTGMLLAPGIVKAAEENYEENPSIANWAQLQLERVSKTANEVSAAALVPTAIPEPTTTAAGLTTIAVAETVDAFASGGSLLIDAVRWGINNPDGIRKFMPKLPMQTNEVLEKYDERAKDYADEGGWDVSGYTF